MKVVLKELRRRKLYFLDSFTSLKSVGVSTARSLGVPCIRRDLFLDNTDDPAYIRRQIKKLRAQARVKGVAVGIGHDKRTTLEVLHEVMPQLQQEGIKFVRISELLEN
ncbi:MAG: divergent polysaccharide deacetylase family protein, partial [Candidatus Omnitrophica bacterium]|nr:divergent polysaccharide deacetylase family protein [Candidatus Omnitrophota bacterium]